MRLVPTCLVVTCLLSTSLGMCLAQTSDWVTQTEQHRSAPEAEQLQAGPIDGRDDIPADAFQPQDAGVWLSPERVSRFEYDELIYSWSARLPKGEGFRLYLQCRFGAEDSTPWIYAGFWGKVSQVERRENPQFEQGRLEMDQALLNRNAVAYRFKVVDEGEKPLSVLPALHIVYTNNTPGMSLWKRFRNNTINPPLADRVLDLPLRSQSLPGRRRTGWCQSAALGSAMEYFGKKVELEDIVPYTFDPEYNYPGIWPRTIGAAVELGFDAYIDRFRDWDQVRATVAENKVILCSIRMPKDGDYIDPPYPSMGGHIVALNGVTGDGRVVVTDSALFRDRRGFRCQWLREDFEKIWMRNKGGVGMVICPPAGAELRLVSDLPSFPGYQSARP